MEITEVRVALRESLTPSGAAEARPGERRLKGYATVTFDRCFVVRNIKIIDGKNGLFVAMPSQKPKVVCTRCHAKVDAGGRCCVQCGAPLSRPAEPPHGAETRTGSESGEGTETQTHRDIAHPITVEFRQYLEEKVLAAYEAERAKNLPRPSGLGVTES